MWCKHRLRGLSHLPWLLPSWSCVHESQRSSSSVGSCCPAASPCCSSSFSSPSSPACSGSRFRSGSASASASARGPWQLLGKGGEGGVTSEPRGDQPCPAAPNPSVQSEPAALANLLQVNSLPAHTLLISPHGLGEFHQPPTPSLGRELAQGQPSAASDKCPQAGFPPGKPSSSFSLCSCCLSLEDWADPAGAGTEQGCARGHPMVTPWHQEPAGEAAPQMDTGKG